MSIVLQPCPRLSVPAKMRTSRVVFTASTEWSNNSPSGPLWFVRRAWDPSTASKVWYKNKPIDQLRYTHGGQSVSRFGLYQSRVRTFMTTNEKPLRVIRFGLESSQYEVLLEQDYRKFLTPSTWETYWWPHECRRVWEHIVIPHYGPRPSTCTPSASGAYLAVCKPCWRLVACVMQCVSNVESEWRDWDWTRNGYLGYDVVRTNPKWGGEKSRLDV